MSYVRPNIAAMAAYVPGEQPRPGTSIIKLNSNENPYSPSPQVVEVLRQVGAEQLRRYPDPFARSFCEAIADVLGVPADWIIVGNGSDDLLNLLVRACADDETRPIVYPTPTYVLYRTLAALQPATVVEVPYPDDFEFPLKDLVAAQGAITFIASPNSPSGHVVALPDLRTLAQQASGLVVVDEAYVDFAEGSALSLVQEFDNVVVLRTLSKGYGLAGLRLGFGIAKPALLAELFKVKDSYNVDAIAIALGTAAIRDQAYKNVCIAKIKASRAALTKELRQLGFTVLDSHGNFVLATPPEFCEGANAEQLYLILKEQGILVRYFKQPRLDDKLRISVGTEAQNHALLAALARLTHPS
ncbi:MAG: histidinol-phosphate transaminase [Tildeniella torsiva UHER 1998/13D]|jgi:histidinol-phosphate aminotransferase|nr:histidinol-phosphate transaminase [Tildeniella torsiva UHER 1998/13D]